MDSFDRDIDVMMKYLVPILNDKASTIQTHVVCYACNIILYYWIFYKILCS